MTTKALFSELLYDSHSERWHEFALPKLSLVNWPHYTERKKIVRSGTGFAIRPLEHGEDGHCMAVAKLEIRLQPLDDGSRFHAWGEFAVLRKPLFLRKRAKVGRTLARLRLNVGKISLE
jgi:hypothetical protein